MAGYEFQAESKRLLDMMIHSIYSQKEIFLRELISNASDAMDKLKYLSLTGNDIQIDEDQMQILIHIDKEKRLLKISDHGIGMNAKELESNLGTIAKSGSSVFRQEIQTQNRSADSLIGQFGVGFYSAFMVADRITVYSKKVGDTQGYRWDSNGLDGFDIQPYNKETYGTDVVLHIRAELDEKSDEYNQFIREYPIYKLVKKYSDYIRYPIKLYMPHPVLKKGSTTEYEEEWSYETLNSMVPLWQRNRREVTKEQQNDFYKEHFSDNEDPQLIVTANVEGSVNYKALLFIPSKQPSEYGTDDYKPGLELYSSSVRIMESCQDLLSEEFNFVRGVVDSPDISLNISREILQKTRQLSTIQNSLNKKIKSKLIRMLNNDREAYEKFHHNFGHHLKVCAMDDYGKKKDILGELLLFYSGKKSKWITLDEYIADMKPEQKYIYYANGSSIKAISNIPQIELVQENDMDVLYFLDQADQFVAQMFGNYHEKQFRSVVNGDLGLESKQTENKQDQNQKLFEFIKDYLGDKVDDVIATTRLKSHPVCLSNGSGITFEMERYFKSLSPDTKMKAKYILEINTEHEAIKSLDQTIKTDPVKAQKYCEILYNQARMIAGLPIEDPSAYTDLLCSLW